MERRAGIDIGGGVIRGWARRIRSSTTSSPHMGSSDFQVCEQNIGGVKLGRHGFIQRKGGFIRQLITMTMFTLRVHIVIVRQREWKPA